MTSDDCLREFPGKSHRILARPWPIPGSILKRLPRKIAQSPWVILACSLGHCCARALGSRAKSVWDLGYFLETFWGDCLGESLGESVSRKVGMGYRFIPEGARGNRAKPLGGLGHFGQLSSAIASGSLAKRGGEVLASSWGPWLGDWFGQSFEVLVGYWPFLGEFLGDCLGDSSGSSSCFLPGCPAPWQPDCCAARCPCGMLAIPGCCLGGLPWGTCGEILQGLKRILEHFWGLSLANALGRPWRSSASALGNL